MLANLSAASPFFMHIFFFSEIVSDMLASRLKHKQRTFLNDCISHLSIVESDSLSVVHLIARKFLSCELHRYELQRLPDMNFQIKDTMSSNVSLRNNFCLYARVFDSPDTIACLSGRNLNIIKYDREMFLVPIISSSR